MTQRRFNGLAISNSNESLEVKVLSGFVGSLPIRRNDIAVFTEMDLK